MLKVQLKNARINKGLSQEALSDLIGMTQSNYSRRENGKKEISLLEWTKIAKILGVSLEEIYEPWEEHSILNNPSNKSCNLKFYLGYIYILEKENAYLKEKLKAFDDLFLLK